MALRCTLVWRRSLANARRKLANACSPSSVLEPSFSSRRTNSLVPVGPVASVTGMAASACSEGVPFLGYSKRNVSVTYKKCYRARPPAEESPTNASTPLRHMAAPSGMSSCRSGGPAPWISAVTYTATAPAFSRRKPNPGKVADEDEKCMGLRARITQRKSCRTGS